VKRLYGWAFAVRLLAGLVAYGTTLYTTLPLLEDALFYEAAGASVAERWLSGRFDLAGVPVAAERAWLLVTGIGVLYYLTGGMRVVPVLFVAYSLVTALVPVYLYWATRELGASVAVAKRAAWLVALSPAFVFWSGSLYKEGLILLFLAVGAYHALRLHSRWETRSLVLVVVSILGLWGVRYYLAALVALAVAASMALRRGNASRLSSVVRQGVVVSAFAALLIALGITEGIENAVVEDEAGILTEVDVRRAGSAREAASGYLHEEKVDTPEAAARYFPLGLLYFLTVPFPWQTGSIRQNLILPENTFWLLLYPLIALGIAQARRVNQGGTMYILLVTGGACAIYALVAANVGTAYRMRSQVWLLWAPFAAWGWEAWRNSRGRRGRERWLLRPRRPFSFAGTRRVTGALARTATRVTPIPRGQPLTARGSESDR
jgi:hypothetical protein